MAGFFGSGLNLDVGTKQVSPAPKRGSSLSGCDGCGRFAKCDSPKLQTIGSGASGIMVVVEAPTKTDDRKGQILSGDSGRVLYSVFKKCGISLDDVWVVPAVRCASYTGDKFDPATSKHGEFCQPLLNSDIQRLSPKVIIPLGPIAISAVLGDRIRGRLAKTKPTAWIGATIPDQESGRWICPSFSLPYVLDSDPKGDIADFFFQNISAAVGCLNRSWPKPPDRIATTTDVAEAIQVLRYIKANALEIAFDYETTGLKPHAKGHRIVCASVGWWDKDVEDYRAFACPFFEDTAFRLVWRSLMLDVRLGKIAHNGSFEATWTFFRAHFEGIDPYWPVGWSGDTCLASHFANSTRPNGLKFRVFTNIGIIGYDDGIDEYLKAEGSNGINRIHEIPLKRLLTYNAFDSLYTIVLHHQDKKTIPDNKHHGIRLLLDGQEALAEIQGNGLPFDAYECQKAVQKTTLELSDLRADILDSDEARRMPRDFNFESNQQLAALLYDKLGFKNGDSRSTDADALETLGTPFAKAILRHRKLSKLKGTYLDGFTTEAVHGVIHPFFNLHRVVTFRSSSDSPNFQNVPKRDKVAQKIIRSCFKPSPGNQIIEYDYGQIEVRISACYHHDPTMIKYVQDPTTDMHRDMAMQLFFRTKDTFTKDERQIAKNSFVFPAFYGSSHKRMAPAIWEQLDEDLKDHLAENGVRSEAGFIKHVAEIENDFWGNRFKRYAEWKKEIWKSYQKLGYVELLTGFRVPGPMGFTDATNYQIQGTAFHCTLYTLTQITKRIAAISGRSKVIGQIHDAIVVDAHPEDVPEIDRLIWFYGTQEIRKVYPWIIVPLLIEKEISEVDGTWASMSKGGELHG